MGVGRGGGGGGPLSSGTGPGWPHMCIPDGASLSDGPGRGTPIG